MATSDFTLTDSLESVASGVAADERAVDMSRPQARGKFLFTGEQKLWLKGVNYGKLGAGDGRANLRSRDAVEQDFAALRAHGINAIRTYDVPPRWLLDEAMCHGIRVMVDLCQSQHFTMLDDAAARTRVVRIVSEGVRACAGHPAVLCYALGARIPESVVRWHGRPRIERFLSELCEVARALDPDGIFTYVGSAQTEQLSLPFLDLFYFDAHFDTREQFVSCIARLQNVVGEKPLIIADVALASQGAASAGEDYAGWSIEAAFAGGCAGTFVNVLASAPDEGPSKTSDNDPITNARLSMLQEAYASVPFSGAIAWPKISVVVCSYNGAPTIRDTLEGLLALEYPNYEVIIVNDGSTDATPEIASGYPFRIISTENRGLSNARNTGWQEATGEIVAYIDDDAYPDPDWLHFLAYTFLTTDYVGVGGPNIAPPGDGPIADCVANAPGGPVHVLLSDTEAEHIPGCNMSFRRENLAQIDGFDARYRAAGDDVDLCWRLQERGWKIGFHPSAIVWHHRRNSLMMYWKQQQGYGKAEALLEEKWPEKYNSMGHYSWSGRLYGKGLTRQLTLGRSLIYEPRLGAQLIAAAFEPATSFLTMLPLMPEWFLLMAGLLAVSVLGLSWPPLLWCVPLLIVAAALPIIQAILSASDAVFPTPRSRFGERLGLRIVTAGLHLLQPVARLKGRLENGLTPWRSRLQSKPIWRPRCTFALNAWPERPRERILDELVASIRELRGVVHWEAPNSPWNIEVRAGLFGRARLALVEIPLPGKPARLQCRCSIGVLPGVAIVAAASAVFATLAALQGAPFAAGALALAALIPAFLSWHQSTAALGVTGAAVRQARENATAMPAFSTTRLRAPE